MHVPGAGNNTLELWKTDGTPNGTGRVAVVDTTQFQAIDTPAVVGITAFDGGVAFILGGGARTTKLWVSDGTELGTHVIDGVDFKGEPAGLYAVGDKLVWPVHQSPDELELVVDGTFLDLRPGVSGSQPKEFALADDGMLYFSADDGEHGRELWGTDGTAGGTRLIADMGVAGSFPTSITRFEGSLYFGADSDSGFKYGVSSSPVGLFRLAGDGSTLERIPAADPRVSVLGTERNQSGRPTASFYLGVGDPGGSHAITLEDLASHLDALRVVGPDGVEHAIEHVENLPITGTAQVEFAVDGDAVGAKDNGQYTVEFVGGKIPNVAGDLFAGRTIGTFALNAPAAGPDLVATVTSKLPSVARNGQKFAATVVV
jgi:ELWxxDGT repeat protein